MFVSITKIRDLDVYVNKGTSLDNAPTVVVPNNGSVPDNGGYYELDGQDQT